MKIGASPDKQLLASHEWILSMELVMIPSIGKIY